MKNSTLDSHTDERALLKEYVRTGSEAAFSELVGRYFGSVRGVARRRLGESSLADDAAQQVFILLSRKAARLCEHPSLGAWLHRSAVLEAWNLARKEERHAKKKWQLKEVGGVEGALRKSAVLDEGLAKLRANERQVLVLHYYEELTFLEVGARLGISEAAAQKRAQRALVRLTEEVKKRGFSDLDTKPCLAMLLGVKPVRESVPQGVVKGILEGKALASYAAMIPLAVVLGGSLVVAAGGYVFEKSRRGPEASAISEVAVLQDEPEVWQAATRSERDLFKPNTADEDLSPEVWRFIELAQEDAQLAFEFAREQPQGIERFLGRAVEALSDRDLAAADRFMGIVEALELRRMTIAAIAGSRVRRSFEDGVGWVDSLPKARDRFDVLDHEADYDEYLDYDYAGALSFVQSPEVRRFLVEEACAKAENEDEREIERLAENLKGAERDLALVHAASLLLRRGDERAFELLEQVEGAVDWLPETREIVKRDPEPLLNWLMEHEGGKRRYSLMGNLMHSWERVNAQAAAEWWGRQSRANLRKQGIQWKEPRFYPVTERLLKK